MFQTSRETFGGNLSICIKFTRNCDKNKCVFACMHVRTREGGEAGRQGGRKVASAVELGLLPRMKSAETQDSVLSAEIHGCVLGFPVYQDLLAF